MTDRFSQLWRAAHPPCEHCGPEQSSKRFIWFTVTRHDMTRVIQRACKADRNRFSLRHDLKM